MGRSDVLETLERHGIRDGSDLPRIARAQALLDAAAAFGLDCSGLVAPGSDYAG